MSKLRVIRRYNIIPRTVEGVKYHFEITYVLQEYKTLNFGAFPDIWRSRTWVDVRVVPKSVYKKYKKTYKVDLQIGPTKTI